MLSNSGVSTEEALVDVTENHAALPRTPNFLYEMLNAPSISCKSPQNTHPGTASGQRLCFAV